MQLLSPVGAIPLSAWIFGERLSPAQHWSAGVLLFGAFLATRVKPHVAAETAETPSRRFALRSARKKVDRSIPPNDPNSRLPNEGVCIRTPADRRASCFSETEVKQLPPNRPSQIRSRPGAKARAKKVENHPETQALMRKLDELYEHLRKRARADWLRHHAGEDPSAASVSVHIACDNGDSITASGKVR